MAAYPPETRRFLTSQPDVFANPVGATLQEEIESLLEWLIDQSHQDEVDKFLDKIIRIRAIQDMTIRQALGSVFEIKAITRKSLGRELTENDHQDDLLIFDSRVDELAMRAFEVYARCREEVHTIRVREVERNTHLLLRRAKLVSYVPPDDGLQAEPDLTMDKD